MKKNKYLDGLIRKMVVMSFKKDGSLDTKKVTESLQSFKSLPTFTRIEAMTKYQKGLKQEVAKSTLVVETATALSESLKNQIVKEMKKSFLITDSEFKVNSSLLGGMMVKIGDTIIDDSLRARAQDVAQRIKNG